MAEMDPKTMHDDKEKEKPLRKKEEEKPAKKEANIEREELIIPVAKHLNPVGLRKKSVFAISIKMYGFGIHVDNEKVKDLLIRAKTGKAESKATEEM